MKLEIVEERRRVAKGLTRLAKKLGVSPGHLSLVLHGKRRSDRLTKRLRRLGVEVAARPAALPAEAKLRQSDTAEGEE